MTHSKARKTQKGRLMVSVRADTYELLLQLQEQFTENQERTNGKQMELTDQGDRGSWISMNEVVKRIAEEKLAHIDRSRKSRKAAV